MVILLKNIILSFLTIMVTITLFLSCSSSTLPVDELIAWVENADHGFEKEKVIGDLVFRARYKPLDYIIAKEHVNKLLTDSSYQEAMERLEALEYVNFSIYPAEGKQFDVLNWGNISQQDHQERIYYYSFTFQQDIYIEQAGEKTPCELFHFVRDHGLSPVLNFALGFEKKPIQGDMKIVINDRVFGNGELNFIIKEKDRLRIPSLKR